MLKSFGIKVKKKLKKLYNYIASRTYKFLTLRLYYPGYYRWHAKKPIQEKKVLFCEVRSLAITDSFKLLIEKFAREGYTTECHCLGETNVGVVSYAKNSLRFLKSMATARYVCISDACNVTSCVEKRPETILVQLWHACGAFKKFGYSTAELIFGVNRKQMDRYPYYKNLNYITVSSPEVSWAYEEAMNSEKFGSKVVATGVSRTDVFFDKSFTEDARATLYTAVPQARGKKLILYAPTFRGGVRSAKSPDVLDIADLREALGDDYFLLIKHHPFVRHPPAIPDVYWDFARDVSGSMRIDHLLSVSDICISDYSSLIFEYSLYERPMLFLAPDIDNYNDWRGFYYDYNNLTPGPVVTTTGEVADYVKQLESGFDKSRVTAFKHKFMASCDGKATEKIFALMTKKQWGKD